MVGDSLLSVYGEVRVEVWVWKRDLGWWVDVDTVSGFGLSLAIYDWLYRAAYR